MILAEQKIKILKNHFEKKAWAEQLYVCGLDEVGRGCLAGPLVVAAVILPIDTSYHLLKDSKVLDPEQRDKAFTWISKHCFWTTGMVNHRLIDTLNIYQATLYAMKKAFHQLTQTLPIQIEKLKYVLIDAMPLKIEPSYGSTHLEFHHFPKGERLSSSIAAASIVAKVIRDNIMTQLIGPQFPSFAFEQHKGYATKQHIDALLLQGPSIIHRKSFITGITTQTNTELLSQQSLM